MTKPTKTTPTKAKSETPVKATGGPDKPAAKAPAKAAETPTKPTAKPVEAKENSAQAAVTPKPAETPAKPAPKAPEAAVKTPGSGDSASSAAPADKPAETAAKPATQAPAKAPEKTPTPPKKPAPAAPAQAAKPAERVVEVRKSGFFSTALGGVVAAGLGAGAMWFGMPNMPEAWRPDGLGSAPAATQVDFAPQISAARDEALAAVTAQSGRIDALTSDLAALKDAPAAAPAEMSGQLQARLNEMQSALDSQKAQLAELASRPAGEATVDTAGIEAAATAALQSKADQMMTDLRSEMDAMRSAAAQEQAAAEDAAARAKAQAALAGLSAALSNGAPLEAPLAALNAAGITTPQALSGELATLDQLTEGFAPAARAALAAAAPLEAEGQGALGLVGAFLKAQTGARSVGGAREGSDADAVLSRAEAALQAGDVTAALNEAAALPQPAQDAMSGWLGQAHGYVDARNALADLAQNLK